MRSPAHLNLATYRSLKPFSAPRVVRYSFRFTSLVPPLTVSSVNTTDPIALHKAPKRMLLKRSYLVLSWVSYLTNLGTQRHEHFKPNIAILPAKRSLYTLTKAPMAHKTNSKEQFMFKFYNFKFSFEILANSSAVASNISQGAYVLHLTRKLFPIFETNLLSLKYYEVSYPICITNFLSPGLTP